MGEYCWLCGAFGGRQERRPDAKDSLCVLQLSLRPQHQGALCRVGPRRQPCKLVRRDQEGQRNDSTLLQAHLWPVCHWPSILYGVWPLGKTRHGCFPFHEEDRAGRGHQDLPRAWRQRVGTRLHVINLGNKDPVTVTYLVECIEEALGKRAVRNYMPMPPTGDVLKTNADVTLAATELGYAPTTPLKEGIQKFIDWYQEYYKDGMDKEMAEYVPM